jgi:competence ComEA-like helix-hairpin-helix protein
MFSLTPDERKVVLFLITVALIGLGIKFTIKINSGLKKFITVEANIAKLNINQVSLEDLLQSQCVSAQIAKRIIQYRNTQGSFQNLEELKEIKGIGDYRYEKLKELFFIE